MRNGFVKFTAGLMASVILVGNISTEVMASPSAGLTKYASDVVSTQNKPTAGVSLSFAESMILKGESATIANNNVPIMKDDGIEFLLDFIKKTNINNLLSIIL